MTRERAITCPACAGEGEQHFAHASGRPDWAVSETCRECNGTGQAVAVDAFDAIVRELINPHGDAEPAVLDFVSAETGISALALEASLARTAGTL